MQKRKGIVGHGPALMRRGIVGHAPAHRLTMMMALVACLCSGLVACAPGAELPVEESKQPRVKAQVVPEPVKPSANQTPASKPSDDTPATFSNTWRGGCNQNWKLYGSGRYTYRKWHCTSGHVDDRYPCDNRSVVEAHYAHISGTDLYIHFRVPVGAMANGAWLDLANHTGNGERGGGEKMLQKSSNRFYWHRLHTSANYNYMLAFRGSWSGYNHYRVHFNWSDRSGNHVYGLRCIDRNGSEDTIRHLLNHLRIIVNRNRCDNHVPHGGHACNGQTRYVCVNPGGVSKANHIDSQWNEDGKCW